MNEDGLKNKLPVAMSLVLALTMASLAWNQVAGNHLPANKIGVSASAVVLLTATLRNSNPVDVQFSVTAECAAAWDGAIFGSGGVQTRAAVKGWVEVDGVPVPASPGASDDRKVVFCNRDTQLNPNIPGGFLSLFEQTKTANAFNWMQLNIGSGVHSIVVRAQLEVFVNGIGFASAGVGKRTLIADSDPPVQRRVVLDAITPRRTALGVLPSLPSGLCPMVRRWRNGRCGVLLATRRTAQDPAAQVAVRIPRWVAVHPGSKRHERSRRDRPGPL